MGGRRQNILSLFSPYDTPSTCRTFCQLAGALAEEGSSLNQIVVRVKEVLKEIGKFCFVCLFFHSH